MKDKSKYTNDTPNAIWMSMCLVVLLIIFIRPLIMQENAFRRVEGEIVTSRIGNNHYHITLNTSRIVYIASHFHNDILQEKAIVGEKTTIWYQRILPRDGRPREYRIQKMTVNNEVVIPFRRGVGMRLIFIGVFSSLLVASIVYIIKARKNGIENNTDYERK